MCEKEMFDDENDLRMVVSFDLLLRSAPCWHDEVIVLQLVISNKEGLVGGCKRAAWFGKSTAIKPGCIDTNRIFIVLRQENHCRHANQACGEMTGDERKRTRCKEIVGIFYQGN